MGLQGHSIKDDDGNLRKLEKVEKKREKNEREKEGKEMIDERFTERENKSNHECVRVPVRI